MNLVSKRWAALLERSYPIATDNSRRVSASGVQGNQSCKIITLEHASEIRAAHFLFTTKK